MRIGIPRETKTLEGRVALIPAAAAELVRRGHEVCVERSAGVLSGYQDGEYEAVGVKVLPEARAVYEAAQLVIKVKEPQPAELDFLRPSHRLFCYLHLAAAPELACRLLNIGLTALGFETVEENDELPLLAPMSDIAGRLAAQIGAYLLHQPQGGRGLLLGGLPAAERGHVVVLGAGTAGASAVRVAGALGAQVTAFERRRDRLERIRDVGHNVTALYPYSDTLQATVREADLLIGAVLMPGERTPHLVSAETVRAMRPGSVIIDVSVDQGGCVETTRPTSYAQPTFVWEGVVHFAVTNMPGAVPRTASQALSAAVLPYALALAEPEWEEHAALYRGVNVQDGKLVHPALQKLALPC